MFPDARENEIVVIAEVVELKPAVNSEKAYSWNHGNEYTMTLEDSKGVQERIRIPAYMKEMFEQYWAITMADNTMAA